MIFLHIGPPKTGTTTIQRFLNINKKKLENKGILYPKSGIKNSGQHNLAWELLDYYEYDKKYGTWSDLFNEIDKNEKIVISSEFFSLLDENGIEKLYRKLRHYEVKIILYLRRQDRLYNSTYVEEIKSGKALCSFKDFILSEYYISNMDHYFNSSVLKV